METIVNEILRSVSIDGRTGRISIALDDDKVWLNLSGSSKLDFFNLKYTTHVKPNRKGIIAHTAVSSGLNIPLGIIFERSRDTTIGCFKRLLNYLFDKDGQTNLRNVSVHSDRGYMLPAVVFEYLVAYGAEVVGTVKRVAQCWPFTYNQTLKENDKRTLVDVKGAPTLFLKWCSVGAKYVFATAFRNGSQSVATCVSTLHDEHQWEGVVLKSIELREYKKDPKSLRDLFFQAVPLEDCNGDVEPFETDETRSVVNDLMDFNIEPYTLRQGK